MFSKYFQECHSIFHCDFSVIAGIPSARSLRPFSDDKKVPDNDSKKEPDSDDDKKNVIPKPGKKKFKKAAPVNKTKNLEEAVEDVVQAELLSQLLGHINATGEQKPQQLNLR